ncbi:MAG: DUF883 domain-containing protein [Casimicrobiaceae bacterium]
MKAIEPVAGVEVDAVTTEKLKSDLRVLAADMQLYLRATANQATRRLAEARASAEDSLQAGKARAADLHAAAMERSRAAAAATDDYVRANPWQGMAICAVAGLVLGIVLAGGRDPES